eukprot:TRINITY_DN7599_c0_g2_i8.p2 TRINITY_DN7599_c0_g2~~TRINITY_DN7599_c0_g2_i8.p2  ORF type:complete len:194 (+),score=-15.69 TRINITY_DN7599_c0_g2_i8:148-729(+)
MQTKRNENPLYHKLRSSSSQTYFCQKKIEKTHLNVLNCKYKHTSKNLYLCITFIHITKIDTQDIIQQNIYLDSQNNLVKLSYIEQKMCTYANSLYVVIIKKYFKHEKRCTQNNLTLIPLLQQQITDYNYMFRNLKFAYIYQQNDYTQIITLLRLENTNRFYCPKQGTYQNTANKQNIKTRSRKSANFYTKIEQ